MDSYLVKPRIYMDRDGLAEVLQDRKKAFIVTDRFMHESGKVSYITDICANIIRWILLCPVCWRWAALSCWLWIRLS